MLCADNADLIFDVVSLNRGQFREIAFLIKKRSFPVLHLVIQIEHSNIKMGSNKYVKRSSNVSSRTRNGTY